MQRPAKPSRRVRFPSSPPEYQVLGPFAADEYQGDTSRIVRCASQYNGLQCVGNPAGQPMMVGMATIFPRKNGAFQLLP
jgi:hypothetical protein